MSSCWLCPVPFFVMRKVGLFCWGPCCLVLIVQYCVLPPVVCCLRICLFFLFSVGQLFSLFLISVLWIHLWHLQSLLWLRHLVQCHFWYNTNSSNILQYRYSTNTISFFHFIWKVEWIHITYEFVFMHSFVEICIEVWGLILFDIYVD